MSKTRDKLNSKKDSWLKKNGVQFGQALGSIAPQAVVLLALNGDPQVQANAILDYNQPGIEELAEANEMEKEKNRAKAKTENQKTGTERKSGKTRSKLDSKKKAASTPNKKSVSKDNKVVVKKIIDTNRNRKSK